MPEFKKKTALGLRDLPENGQECTHVLLTHSEYDGLLAKVACAERDARSVYTAASQKIAQAERNSAQAKEAAYAEVNAVQKDLEEACRKIEYLNGLNKNLLRIARERANADRKLRPKKTHTGYVVLTSSEKEYRYVPNGRIGLLISRKGYHNEIDCYRWRRCAFFDVGKKPCPERQGIQYHAHCFHGQQCAKAEYIWCFGP